MSYLLSERFLDGFTIQDLDIGYCDWNSKDDIGISLYGRITFPIHDFASGDVIGFGGRIIQGEGPKYLNSPASSIYDKSRVLYNLYNAQDYIIDSGSAIIVEGYMDVAMLWKYGIRNVVATCGTAMTRWHLRLLKRYCERVFLLYDDDKAGDANSGRVTSELAGEMFPLHVVSPGFGMDPDEYIRMFGKESLLELLNEAGKEKA